MSDWISEAAYRIRQQSEKVLSEAAKAAALEKMKTDLAKGAPRPGEQGLDHVTKPPKLAPGSPAQAGIVKDSTPQATGSTEKQPPTSKPPIEMQPKTESRAARTNQPASTPTEAGLPKDNYPKVPKPPEPPKVTNVWDAHENGTLGKTKPPEPPRSTPPLEPPPQQPGPIKPQPPKPYPQTTNEAPRAGGMSMTTRVVGGVLGPVEVALGAKEIKEGIEQKDRNKIVEGALHTVTGAAVTTAAFTEGALATGAMKVAGAGGFVLAGLDGLHDVKTAGSSSGDTRLAYGASGGLKLACATGMLVEANAPAALATYAAGSFGWMLGRQISERCGFDEPLTKGMGYYLNTSADQAEARRANERSAALKFALQSPINTQTGNVEISAGQVLGKSMTATEIRGLALTAALDQVELSRRHGDQNIEAYYQVIYENLKIKS